MSQLAVQSATVQQRRTLLGHETQLGSVALLGEGDDVGHESGQVQLDSIAASVPGAQQVSGWCTASSRIAHKRKR